MAITYLVLAGSLLAFVAFIYSMKKLPAALSSLYAYINPLVAMVSGALYLGEALTLQMLAGCAVVLLGTAMSLGLIGRPRAPP